MDAEDGIFLYPSIGKGNPHYFLQYFQMLKCGIVLHLLLGFQPKIEITDKLSTHLIQCQVVLVAAGGDKFFQPVDTGIKFSTVDSVYSRPMSSRHFLLCSAYIPSRVCFSGFLP